MKSIAEHDRPREKLARLGAAALGDNELVAILLGQGQPRNGALDLANHTLAAIGGIAGLSRVGSDELQRIGGIGPARAAQLLAQRALMLQRCEERRERAAGRERDGAFGCLTQRLERALCGLRCVAHDDELTHRWGVARR